VRRSGKVSWRQLWPWLLGSLVLHLSVLCALPGADGPRRCPLLLVTLDTAQAKPEPALALTKPAAPAAPLPQVKRVEPREEKRIVKPQEPEAITPASKPEQKSSAVAGRPSLPITTTNPTATDTVVVPAQVPAVATTEELPLLPGSSSSGSSSPEPSPPAEPPAAAGGNEQGEAVAKPSIDVGALKRRYAAGALAKVQRAKYFPESAKDPERAGTTVQVRVSFRVSPSGSLTSVSAAGGGAELNAAAEDAVRRAAPFGSFPEGLELGELKLGVTLEYTLR
jgi:protein TonB